MEHLCVNKIKMYGLARESRRRDNEFCKMINKFTDDNAKPIHICTIYIYLYRNRNRTIYIYIYIEIEIEIKIEIEYHTS